MFGSAADAHAILRTTLVCRMLTYDQADQSYHPDLLTFIPFVFQI